MNSEERQQQLTTALAQIMLPSGIEIRPWSEADFPTIQMRSNLPFTPHLRGSGVTKAVVGNAWWKHLATTAKSMALGWSIGVMTGSMVEWLWRVSRRVVAHHHQRKGFESFSLTFSSLKNLPV
jgi:hypothetical protein